MISHVLVDSTLFQNCVLTFYSVGAMSLRFANIIDNFETIVNHFFLF